MAHTTIFIEIVKDLPIGKKLPSQSLFTHKFNFLLSINNSLQ